MNSNLSSSASRFWNFLRSNFLLLTLGTVCFIIGVVVVAWILPNFFGLNLPQSQALLLSVIVVPIAIIIVLILRAYWINMRKNQSASQSTGSLLLLGTFYVIILLFAPLLIPVDTRFLLPQQIIFLFLLIGGVIALLQVLGLLAALFFRFRLNNPNEALGLPQGSVRAMIALVLLLIFAIFIFYLFGSSRGQTETMVGLNLEQANAILRAYGEQVIDIERNSDTQLYTIAVRYEISEAAHDIGSQILTTLGTLATAIAAFYFGTNSVAAARGTTSTLAPNISGLSGATRGSPGATGLQFTITGQNFDAERVSLEGAETIAAAIITLTATDITCEVDIPQNAVPGLYTVVVTNKDNSEAHGPVTFRVA